MDLSALDAPYNAVSAGSKNAFRPVVGFSQAPPSSDRAFKVFFDLALFARSDLVDMSFGNFHSYVFMDIFPKKDVQFSFDVSSARGSPSFYELDWQMTSWFQLRMGKIWIPFDDVSPHSIFGGRVNVSTLAPQAASASGTPSAQFLPNLWTDLGVGAKFQLIDRTEVELNSYLFVVNGFGSGGTDPVTSGATYPSFSDSGILSFDNNKDKAIGGRAHLILGRRFGIGVSGYTGRWNDDRVSGVDQAPLRANIFGVDTQLFLKSAEVRAGIIAMRVDVVGDTISRGGAYGEFGIPVGRWKLLFRGGTRQLDDRRLQITDQTIVGGMLMYRYSFLQLSFEYTKDLKQREGKLGGDFQAVRAVFEL